MTPEHLGQRLPPGLSVHDPSALLGEIEARADASPHDLDLHALLREVHAYATAADGLAPVVAGVRRERLVRWDAHTATFHGTSVFNGHGARVRVLRAPFAQDPVLRRALAREGRVLRDACGIPVMSWHAQDVALTLELPGEPLRRPVDDESPEDRVHLARMLATALDGLARAEAAGASFPELEPEEWVEVDGRARLVALTVAPPRSDGALVRCAARAVARWWGHTTQECDLERLLAGFDEFPPPTAKEALAEVTASLRDDLVRRRHALHALANELSHALRRERLHAATRSLTAAVPPPAGMGAVGVDLDGRVTTLRGENGQLWWDDALLYGEQGFDVRAARRLVRMRAAAPPNPRIQAGVGGDEAFVERACRWVAAGLALRTVRLLLDATA